MLTHQVKDAVGNVNFYNGSIKDLVKELKSRSGRNIFCDGGAEVVNALLMEQLIDEFVISIIPILLGEGVRLFKAGQPEQDLQLLSIKSFDTGLVQLHYKRN